MVLEGLLYARHRARRWRCSPDTHTPDFCLHRTYSLKRESEKTNRSQPENLGEKKENIFSSTLESAIFQGDIKLRDIIFGVTIVCMGLKAVRMRSPKKTSAWYPEGWRIHWYEGKIHTSDVRRVVRKNSQITTEM
ncbi:uncharacterized protein LOC119867182 isoform X9 [Canis lupus familiaris]|uniref:uncharacterized protein LOC119867182 isoform X9 n=1 Tax=Canis lupus familiaris TaxID=9615 RepID=UPI0018F350F8|nr:uncharacterized protein LOC119867182 isoform X9 [Canis lupus familiaris]